MISKSLNSLDTILCLLSHFSYLIDHPIEIDFALVHDFYFFCFIHFWVSLFIKNQLLFSPLKTENFSKYFFRTPSTLLSTSSISLNPWINCTLIHYFASIDYYVTWEDPSFQISFCIQAFSQGETWAENGLLPEFLASAFT